jgi:hypothetical protein
MSDYKVDDKVVVTENIATIDGMLYKGEVCKIDGVTFLDKDLRLKDNMGKIWYVMEYQVKLM